MYCQLEDSSELIANRQCGRCLYNTDIYQCDLLYKRNPITLFKKECYAYCKSEGCKYVKIHISKKFIPSNVLKTVPEDKTTREEQYEHYLNVVNRLNIEIQCKNCKIKNTITYEKLLINRDTSINIERLIGYAQVYFACEHCDKHNILYNDYNNTSVISLYDKHGFKAFVEKYIDQYDSRNIYRNSKTFLKNLPLGLLFYTGVLITSVPLSIIYTVIVYGTSKDTIDM